MMLNKTKMMKGLRKRVNASSTSKGVITVPPEGMISCKPSEAKKIIAKKSFKGLTVLMMFK